VGVTMYSYFSKCDPVTLGVIKKTDQVGQLHITNKS
jgi:hypothetical protein